MQCLYCENTNFKEKSVRFNPKVREEEVKVVVPAFVCTKCKKPLMDSNQMDQLRKVSSDKYREKHGLLTSEQIVAHRKRLSMSQRQFADYLRIGIASIKRWETNAIQDASQDEIIRLKCDQAYAEKNSLEIQWKSHTENEFNGNRVFNFERFKNMCLYLLKVAKSPLYLNKALFYAEFKHYQKYQESIAGTCFVPLEYGPCPDQYQNIFNYMIDQNYIRRGRGHNLTGLGKPDLNVFDSNEQKTLKEVFSMAKKDNGRTLFEKSHEEDAYKKTPAFKPISYKFAGKLKL